MANIGKAISGFLTFIWNNKTKEFVGRDGASWAKICLFYGVFYVILAGFWIGMLAVFRQTLDDVRPTYYDKSSTMNIGKDFETGKARVNPGLGFRPQIDPEASLIYYSIDKLENPTALGDFSRLNANLVNFQNRYYNNSDAELEIANCETSQIEDIRSDLKKNKHCPVSFDELLNSLDIADRSDADPFGYNSVGPVVILKLNRIYNWLPQALDSAKLPDALQEIKKRIEAEEPGKVDKFNEVISRNVIVVCDGEYAADRDNVRSFDVTYSSLGPDKDEFNKYFGVLPFYFYPYLNQKNYESPLIFTQFKIIKTGKSNVLTNVLCRAYAGNIDQEDKLNRRGMTQFVLYVASANKMEKKADAKSN